MKDSDRWERSVVDEALLHLINLIEKLKKEWYQ